MAKLRPGLNCFLLQIDACVLIESPLSDPLAALDHFLTSPDSKPVSVNFTEAVTNRSATRRVRLSPLNTSIAATAEAPAQQQVPTQLNNLIQLDHYRRQLNSPA